MHIVTDFEENVMILLVLFGVSGKGKSDLDIVERNRGRKREKLGGKDEGGKD